MGRMLWRSSIAALVLACAGSAEAFTGTYGGQTQDLVSARSAVPDGKPDYQLTLSNLSGTVTGVHITNPCGAQNWVSPQGSGSWTPYLINGSWWMTANAVNCTTPFTVVVTYQGGATETASIPMTIATGGLPGAPTVTVSAVPSPVTSSRTLSWDTNTETDLAGYRVYRRTGSSYGAALADVGLATSYPASGLVAGTTYWFTVTAYDRSGNESVKSNEVNAVIP